MFQTHFGWRWATFLGSIFISLMASLLMCLANTSGIKWWALLSDPLPGMGTVTVYWVANAGNRHQQWTIVRSLTDLLMRSQGLLFHGSPCLWFSFLHKSHQQHDLGRIFWSLPVSWGFLQCWGQNPGAHAWQASSLPLSHTPSFQLRH